MRKIVMSLAGVLFIGGVASAGVPSPAALHHHTQSSVASAMHKAHEERALIDIQLAEAEAKAGKVASAEKAAAHAIQQLHEAIALHQHHSQLHQHHHTHLTTALNDLKAAEKQFHTGHVGTAEKDLAKAAHQIREALKHHQ